MKIIENVALFPRFVWRYKSLIFSCAQLLYLYALSVSIQLAVVQGSDTSRNARNSNASRPADPLESL